MQPAVVIDNRRSADPTFQHESCHLEHDRQKAMVLGGYCIAEAQTEIFTKAELSSLAISPAKPPHSNVAIYAIKNKSLDGIAKEAYGVLTKTLKNFN